MREVRKLACVWVGMALFIGLYYAMKRTSLLSHFVDTNNPETWGTMALLGVIALFCYVRTLEGDGGDWNVWGGNSEGGGDSSGDGGGD